MPVDPQHFKAGMRRLAAGVTVLTTLYQGERRGLTATAVCSVSVAPPTLLCCVNRQSSAHDFIVLSGIIAVNLLAAEDHALASRFSGAEIGEARFAFGRWSRLTTGAPVLETACAAFDCTVVQTIDAGSHTIFLANVEATHAAGAADPLLYLDGRYGGFAPLA